MADDKQRAGGYHQGGVDTVISVEDVIRQVEEMRTEIPAGRLLELAAGKPYVSIEGLRAEGLDVSVGFGYLHG